MNPLSQICEVMGQLQQQTQYLCAVEHRAIAGRDTATARQARAQRAVLASDLALTQAALTRFPAANDSE